ncbi:hypothetical protein [Shewanella spartinae]|uniref:hypothetical protein n=1 Tax=Shewanella spartinae TaxID=2864205 RepID=UPI001C655571|nr:hypothetical protein [Shewanella spartinae]QYJ93068.1 hypothetical protein K0I31_15920 [Shewanella spartinae]
MTSRPNASKARHAESLIKIGENIHNAIILTIFVAPLIFLAKEVFEGRIKGISGMASLLIEHQAPLLFLFSLLILSAFIGMRFKHWGFDILDELEIASGKKEDNHKMPELS